MVRRRRRDSAGWTTVEYAVGVVAACGFAAVLLQIAPVMFHILRRILGAIDGLAWNIPGIVMLP